MAISNRRKIKSNQLKIHNLQSAVGEKKLLAYDEDGKIVDGSDLANLNTFNNGLTEVNNNVTLGGEIVQPTELYRLDGEEKKGVNLIDEDGLIKYKGKYHDDYDNRTLIDKEYLDIELNKLAPPVEYIAPTLNLTTNQISTGREVGEVIDAVLTAFYNKNDAGNVTKIEYLKNGSVIHTINNPPQSTSYTDEDIVLSTTPISYTARITYEQGPVKNNSLGNPSPSGRIEAGSLTSVQRNALGTYIVCFGAVSSVPTNSAQARSMTTVVRGGVDVRILDCGTVDIIQAILLPPGTNLVSVIDLDAAMQDLTIQYILEDSNFTVNDASGNPVSGYKLYVRTQGTPYPTNHRHQFTMS